MFELNELANQNRHGTGHGIGAYLKVHEGPILVRQRADSGKLQPGMFFSDEPGFYKVISLAE